MGIKSRCQHCGHTWDYTGNNDVTSCPNCGWRVRINTRRMSTPEGNNLLPHRENDRLI